MRWREEATNITPLMARFISSHKVLISISSIKKPEGQKGRDRMKTPEELNDKIRSEQVADTDKTEDEILESEAGEASGGRRVTVPGVVEHIPKINYQEDPIQSLQW